MNWNPNAVLNLERWTPSTLALSAADFTQEVAAHFLVIVHFWALWSHIDRSMDAALQELIPS